MLLIISYFPPLQTTGYENSNPFGIPYSPFEWMAIEVQSSDPKTQSLICSIAPLAAEAADESFLAAIISAPLFPIFGWKKVSIHLWSNKSVAFFPLTVVFVNIGTMVGEWLPQILKFPISVTLQLSF